MFSKKPEKKRPGRKKKRKRKLRKETERKRPRRSQKSKRACRTRGLAKTEKSDGRPVRKGINIFVLCSILN